MRRTIKQRVDEFIKKNPRKQFLVVDMNEIHEIGDICSIMVYSYYLGYMRGMRAKKGGTR